MNQIDVKAATRVDYLSILGPASVILSILLLVVKESPFYIDLSVTALFGIVVCWRFRQVGLYVSSVVLSSILAYDFIFDGEPFSLWDLGLGLSIQLSFIATALAREEIAKAFYALQAAGEKALEDFKAFQGEVTQTLTKAETLIGTNEALERRALLIQDELKSERESLEMHKRLLFMAKEELGEEVALKERFQRELFNEKHKIAFLEQKLEDKEFLSKQISILEEELLKEKKAYSKMMASQKELAEEELKRQADEYEQAFLNLQSKSEIEITTLGEKLEALIDHLREVQNEKEELAKGLEEALKPRPIKETLKMYPLPGNAEALPDDTRTLKGLYFQLRSQFEEQKQLLSETRKTLFHKEEALALKEKEWKETFIYDKEGFISAYSDEIAALQARLLNAELELEILKSR